MGIPAINNDQAKAFASFFSPYVISQYCDKHKDKFIAFLKEETAKGDMKSATLLTKMVYDGRSIKDTPQQAAGVDKQAVEI